MVTDLTNTTWLLKKPSEWVKDERSTGSGAKDYNYHITANLEYNTYISAINSEIVIRDYMSEGVLAAIILAFGTVNREYPIISISKSDVGNVFFIETSASAQVVLGDVRVLMTITGGDDAANTDLIAWLNANATQLPVTDLTGTTWRITPYGYTGGTYSILHYNIQGEYTYDNNEYTFTYVHFRGDNGPTEKLWFNNSASAINTYPSLYVQNNTSYPIIIQRRTAEVEDWQVNSIDITFTGGTDVTNTAVIAWLAENAEMQSPAETYTITTTGTNVTFSGDTEITESETATVYITPGETYVSPYPISVTGADYVYNRIHNSVTLSNPTENIIIVANATERISEYMKKGGYQILDLKEVNLTLGTESEIEGTTDTLVNSNNKAILVSGLVIGSTPIGDFFTQFTETSGVYTAVATVGETVLTIVVDDDGVTVTDGTENT